MLKLRKVISGGQIGVDQAGLRIAKEIGLETGGYLPKGCITKNGKDPSLIEKYGMIELDSDSYKKRTWTNVETSDGTIRLAHDFKSRGEICTLNAIIATGKPHFDVDLNPMDFDIRMTRSHVNFIQWLDDNNIEVLNIAGNATEESGEAAYIFLKNAFCKIREVTHPIIQGTT